MNWTGLVASLFLGLVSVTLAQAETIVVAVEDKDYTPYYTWVDGELHGPCAEITAGAIRLMGVRVRFVRYPWVRVLKSVETKKVDAGLCGTKTDERASYSYYPDEPLLNYDVTLFVRAASPLVSSNISGLADKSFGLVKGYNFGGIDDRLESEGMVRIEANSRDSMLKMLMLGRVDTILDSILPLFADAERMGVASDIRTLPPSLDETPGYLFFSRKPGYEELAKRFSEALTAYKTTEEYLAIKTRYGL